VASTVISASFELHAGRAVAVAMASAVSIDGTDVVPRLNPPER
jgi:hypothetical protein